MNDMNEIPIVFTKNRPKLIFVTIYLYLLVLLSTRNVTTLPVAFFSCVEIFFAEFDLNSNRVDLTYT